MSDVGRSLLQGLVLVLLLASSAPVHAARPGMNRCPRGRLKCIGRLVVCSLKVEAAARASGTAVDAVKLQRCHDDFDGAGDPTRGCFGKVDAGPEDCGLTSTTAAEESTIDQFVNDVVSALDPNPADDANTCTANKLKCVKTKTKCLIEAMRSGLARYGGPFDDILQKCRDRFDGDGNPARGCFARLEAAGGCLTHDDTPALETRVECFMNDETDVVPNPWGCATPTPTPTSTP
jgi:hypothetical protein